MFKYELIGDNDYVFDIIGTLSANREVDNLLDFLELDESSILDWRLLKNIKKASTLIAKHIDSNSHIKIVVDSDADGYTSAAIAYMYLKMQNKDLNITYHIHDRKVHGIKKVEVDKGIDLLLIPDASSNEHDEHKRFYDAGIDVVVVDHHEIEDGESPYATVVNPQLNKVGNLSFSGAGMMFKVCQALDDIYDTDYAEYFLDLVAVGNIGDVMSMKELETRYYVNEGLNNINNEFLQALIDKQSYSMKGKLNPTTIGFYITPLINAVTRVGTYEERVDLFKAFIEHREMVEYKPRGKDSKVELVPFISDFARQCTNIKNRQDRMKIKLTDEINETLDVKDEDKVLIIKDVKLKDGLGGLIATQLANKYMKPVLMLNYNKEEDNYAGSGRSYGGFDGLKDILNNSTCVEYAKGHGSAFGLAVSKDKYEDIQNSLNNLLEDVDFEAVHKVDFVIPLKSINKNIIDDITELSSIWGKDIPEPKIVVNDFNMSDVNLEIIGSKLDTISMKRGAVTFIVFKQSQDMVDAIRNAKQVELIGVTKKEKYKGLDQYQIVVNDINILK